ncbi:hypothetical protein [Mesorhizobium sophorae]|uniref:hypothetical protein n=1 Tax=Mesorhizobium sophorae TaxID=1300294 RepID=UPI000BA41C54|nr:hypothetical protein [Mesorhizobium sophorae]
MLDYSDKVKGCFFVPKNAGILETATALCKVKAIYKLTGTGSGGRFAVSINHVCQKLNATWLALRIIPIDCESCA